MPDPTAPRARLTRRTALGAGVVALGGGALAWPALRDGFWAALTQDTGAAALAAPDALERVRTGALVLVDIRRPDEWARTGIAEGALALDMRRADFAEALTAALGGNRSAPVAVICARGVRSAALANRLAAAGFTALIDVPEGMMGSRAGPGWLARGLPVRPCAGPCS